MALIRRNPAAAFEQPAPETTPAAAAAAPAQAPAQAPTPPPVQQPAQPAAPIATPPAGSPPPQTITPAPVQSVSGNANIGGATPERTALVRRDANAGAVGALVQKVPPALEHLKNAFTVDYDTFERLKSGSGNIVDSQNNSLGSEIEMTVVSWQDTWDISPGSDSPEAKADVRYSDDGITIKDSGQTISAYLDELRAKGWKNASCKQKAVVVGVLDAAEKPTNLLGQTVQVSLSNQSRKTFDRHRFDATLKVQLGKLASTDGAEKINIKAEARSGNGKNYTLLIVSQAAPV